MLLVLLSSSSVVVTVVGLFPCHNMVDVISERRVGRWGTREVGSLEGRGVTGSLSLAVVAVAVSPSL